MNAFILSFLSIGATLLVVQWIVVEQEKQNTEPTTIKEVIEQQQNNYIFKENISFTISGAVKIEEIGQMVEVEKLDENLNKTKVKEYQPLFTEGGYGGQIYRVTFQDGTTKRYYYQFSRTGDGEWLPLDFGPYKN